LKIILSDPDRSNILYWLLSALKTLWEQNLEREYVIGVSTELVTYFCDNELDENFHLTRYKAQIEEFCLFILEQTICNENDVSYQPEYFIKATYYK